MGKQLVRMLATLGGLIMLISLSACSINGQQQIVPKSADDICAADLPDVGLGDGFYVGTTSSLWQNDPNLTAAGYTGACLYADPSAPGLGLSGYICLDESQYALFGLVTDFAGADTECQTIQSVHHSYTLIHATRS
jgi:hypothetical protein